MAESRNSEPPSPGKAESTKSSYSSNILSKIPFTRASQGASAVGILADDVSPAASSIQGIVQQERKTRRRGGSLRKAALLGKSAQRDRRDDTHHATDALRSGQGGSLTSALHDGEAATVGHGGLGLDINGFSAFSPEIISATALPAGGIMVSAEQDTDQGAAGSYASTTDDEDVLQLPPTGTTTSSGIPASPGTDSYFGNSGNVQRKRSFQQVKSPLSYSGMSTTTMPSPDSDWDYSETEWWGWVVLSVTWLVFVVGMGSCLDVWSWAWDVGKTPYAPPELEDDDTLPIVGYYPALIILTCIMAWVWVVVAWVGMKYFRHAKISGD